MAVSFREFFILCETLQDALDDDKWTDEWKKRVRPVRERFRDIERKLNELDGIQSGLECSGVKVVSL